MLLLIQSLHACLVNLHAHGRQLDRISWRRIALRSPFKTAIASRQCSPSAMTSDHAQITFTNQIINWANNVRGVAAPRKIPNVGNWSQIRPHKVIKEPYHVAASRPHETILPKPFSPPRDFNVRTTWSIPFAHPVVISNCLAYQAVWAATRNRRIFRK